MWPKVIACLQLREARFCSSVVDHGITQSTRRFESRFVFNFSFALPRKCINPIEKRNVVNIEENVNLWFMAIDLAKKFFQFSQYN